MTNEEIGKKIAEKVSNDYVKAIKSLSEESKKTRSEVEFFINRAYQVAHYNEVEDVMESMDLEDIGKTFGDLLEEILSCDNVVERVFDSYLNYNVVERIFDSYLNYNHPERYNFFAWEDFIDIFRYALINNR